MTPSRTGALVVVLLVATLAVPIGPTAGATASTQTDCSNRVVYDQFRFDNATVDAAANGSATASAQNTEVRVEQATGFLRVNATNPNGYCVEFHVRIDEAVVSPAELGAVESNDDSVEAEWHSVRDFDRDETYTEVVFVLPAASTATFAPSKVRVKSLSWTGTATDAGGSWWESISNVSIGDDEEEKLQQRTYRFSAANSTETITVSLRNESSGKSVEEWQAMYRTSNESAWKPVSTDSEAPVFYREVSEHRVQFVFNDPDAEVRFTAEPTRLDKAKHEWESWQGGTDVLGDLLDGLFD